MRRFFLFLAVVAFCCGQVCAPSPGDLPGDGNGDAITDGTGGGNGGTTDGGGDGTTDGGGDGTTDGGGNGDGGGDQGGSGQSAPIIADHLAAAAFNSIPQTYIQSAQSTYRIFYGHTSHGSQIVTGMDMLYTENSLYAYNAGAGTLTLQERDDVDLGYEGDLTWVTTTRDVLNAAGNNINMVLWSWCGGVSENTEAGIDAYLDAMNQLETDYPNVVFVYMTGHLEGTGPNDNLNARNSQIRDYCRANNKILFDFADVESYDPDGAYYSNGGDACEWCGVWCASHTCPTCDECQHSHCFNCYQKGKAFWWMMARIAGWDGTS